MNNARINMNLFLIFVFLCCFMITLISYKNKRYYRRKKISKSKVAEIKRTLKPIMDGEKDLSYEQFESIRELLFGTDIDFKGIYIIINVTKNIYLIGSSSNIFSRISRHFKGAGNGDLYSDYKYGDTFIIRMKYLTDKKYSDVKTEINKIKRGLNVIKTY